MKEITVVIADDHCLFRQGLVELLSGGEDMRVVGQAGDGREALDLVKSLKPDIVFLDIQMPRLSGLSVISEMVKASPDTRILILSMYDKGSYVASALSQGASGYLLKDDGADTLFMAVEEVMNGRVYLSERVNQLVIQGFSEVVRGSKYISPIDALSPREKEVLQLIVEGGSSKSIASTLCISIKTVEHHRANIMSKLSCNNVRQLILLAAKEGLFLT